MEKGGQIVKKEIGSKMTEVIAEVRLLKNWRLKSKFRFTLKNPKMEKQREYIEDKLKVHNSKVQMALKFYPQISFSMMTQEQCYKKLKDLNAPNFIDLEFQPFDKSVFDPTIDADFDIVVHWRRPSEFLHVDFS